MFVPGLAPDARRCLWVLGLLLLGWVLLGLCLSNIMLQVAHGMLYGTLVVLTPWLKSCVFVWTGLSLLSHACWYCVWGEDYHRLVIHCAYLEERTNRDGLDGFIVNLGTLPGYILGVCLTD